MTECPGCPLDNSSTDTTRSTNSHYFNQFPCRIRLPHDEVVKLNVLPKKKFSRDLPMEFNTTLTNITSDINACFTISTEHTSFPQLLSSVFDHGKAQLSFASINTTTLTAVTKDARSFTKDIFDAINFCDLLSLSRCSNIRVLNDQKLIDWPATWSLFGFHTNNNKSSTNFKHSSRIAFNSKMLMGELPLLDKLVRRRPDLYNSNWKCIMCN